MRLCAERPREDYRPTPGTAEHVRWPEGAGLRVDRGIEDGSVVSPAYDSLVAKLMAHGDDRAAAIGRLSLALRRLELDGLETNRDLLQAVLDDEAFRLGQADIHYLDGRPDLRQARLPDEARWRQAAAASARLLDERAARSLVPVPAAGWRNVGTALHADVLTDAAGDLRGARLHHGGRGFGPRRRRVARRGHGDGRATAPSTWWRTGCCAATTCATRPTAPT